MNYESYRDILFTEDLREFVFDTVGPCGHILKGVKFKLTDWPGIVMMYTEKYPNRIIHFRGSTAGRTRLYRMAINVCNCILNQKKITFKFVV